MRLHPRTIYPFCIILLFSCNPPPNEVIRNYSGLANFHLYTGDLDVEFVKDSTEYVKFIGNFYGDPIQQFQAIENDYSYWLPPALYLSVKASYMTGQYEPHKVEIHYVNLRRIIYFDTPPTSFGTFLHYKLYSREPIISDSIDLSIRDRQDSVLEVNTSVLNISSHRIVQTKISGLAGKLISNLPITCNANDAIYINFGELITDSCYLTAWNSNFGYIYKDYARADVYATTYLEVHVQDVIGTPSECPTCIFEVYYKGYPTIHNLDSLDSRIVVIDNN